MPEPGWWEDLISVRLVLPCVPVRKHPVIWSTRQGDPDQPLSAVGDPQKQSLEIRLH
jgi:hypothetical protein